MVVAGALLMAVAACGVAYEVALNSRYKVIGITDPASGYHIEYTVSTRYVRSRDPNGAAGIYVTESCHYTPPQIPKAMQWVKFHILRDAAYADLPGSGPGAINQRSDFGLRAQGIIVAGQGYPVITWMSRLGNVTVKHLFVGDSPATWCEYTYSTGPKRRNYLLLIKPKNPLVSYVFSVSDNPVDSTGAEYEMIKIRDSIRILKAP